MSQNIKIIPDFQRTILMPSVRRPEDNLMPVDYGGDLEVVEVAEELNDAAKMKESSTFDADIPYNTNNRWMVEKYGNSIPILASAHGLQLPDREIRVNGYAETSAQYDVSFVRSLDWPEILKGLAISDIDGFDPFQLSEAFIDDNQLNDVAYPGPDPTPTRGFWTPIVYYGGLNRFNEANSLFELTYADFRIWFHYGKLLEQFFFAAGYRMDCPFLLTEYGQRMGAYAVGGAKIYEGVYSKTRLKNKLQLPAPRHYAFLVEKTAPQAITGTEDPLFGNGEIITFQNDSTGGFYDNGAAVAEGFYNTTDEVIQGFSGMWRYHIKLKITGAGAPVFCNLRFFYQNETIGAGVKFIYQVYYDEGGTAIAIGSINITVPATMTTEFNFYVTVEAFTSLLDIGFGFDVGSGITVEAGSTIEGHGEFVVISTQTFFGPFNDNINETIVFPQSWLSPEIKAIEIIESYCHRTNSKLYTDRARRIVGIYTEHDVPTYGEATEPYYFDTIEQDLHLMQVDQSAQVNLKDVVAPAKYILGFKESTDAYIESVAKETPFDAVIDMAPYADNIDPDKTVENRDNLTEPTLERPFIEVKSTNPNYLPINVLAVLDNLVGEPSTNTSPRTAYFYGIVRQRTDPFASTYKRHVRRWAGIRQETTQFAYATQYPLGELNEPGSPDPIDNDKTLVYDHTEEVTEPMKRYWIDTIAVLYTSELRKLTILVGSYNRFLQLNFRHLFRFKFMGLDWKGRLTLKRTRVNDFRRVEIEAREDKQC